MKTLKRCMAHKVNSVKAVWDTSTVDLWNYRVCDLERFYSRPSVVKICDCVSVAYIEDRVCDLRHFHGGLRCLWPTCVVCRVCDLGHSAVDWWWTCVLRCIYVAFIVNRNFSLGHTHSGLPFLILLMWPTSYSGKAVWFGTLPQWSDAGLTFDFFFGNGVYVARKVSKASDLGQFHSWQTFVLPVKWTALYIVKDVWFGTLPLWTEVFVLPLTWPTVCSE